LNLPTKVLGNSSLSAQSSAAWKLPAGRVIYAGPLSAASKRATTSVWPVITGPKSNVPFSIVKSDSCNSSSGLHLGKVKGLAMFSLAVKEMLRLGLWITGSSPLRGLSRVRDGPSLLCARTSGATTPTVKTVSDVQAAHIHGKLAPKRRPAGYAGWFPLLNPITDPKAFLPITIIGCPPKDFQLLNLTDDDNTKGCVSPPNSLLKTWRTVPLPSKSAPKRRPAGYAGWVLPLNPTTAPKAPSPMIQIPPKSYLAVQPNR